MPQDTDTESGDRVGAFPTQEAARDVVRSCVERDGETATIDDGLGGEDESGKLVSVAFGEDLIRLAFAEAARVSATP